MYNNVKKKRGGSTLVVRLDTGGKCKKFERNNKYLSKSL